MEDYISRLPEDVRKRVLARHLTEKERVKLGTTSKSLKASMDDPLSWEKVSLFQRGDKGIPVSRVLADPEKFSHMIDLECRGPELERIVRAGINLRSVRILTLYGFDAIPAVNWNDIGLNHLLWLLISKFNHDLILANKDSLRYLYSSRGVDFSLINSCTQLEALEIFQSFQDQDGNFTEFLTVPHERLLFLGLKLSIELDRDLWIQLLASVPHLCGLKYDSPTYDEILTLFSVLDDHQELVPELTFLSLCAPDHEIISRVTLAIKHLEKTKCFPGRHIQYFFSNLFTIDPEDKTVEEMKDKCKFKEFKVSLNAYHMDIQMNLDFKMKYKMTSASVRSNEQGGLDWITEEFPIDL